LRIGNVFHAGDGNLHPLISATTRRPGQAARRSKVASEILQYCGRRRLDHRRARRRSRQEDSMSRMFAPDDLDTMQLVRCAFDPTGICNPQGVSDAPRLCGEVPGPYRQHPLEQAGVAERF
jgi:glycolate oxidase